MHDVSNAINSIDHNKDIDKKICKEYNNAHASDEGSTDTIGKCGGIKKSGGGAVSKYRQLSHMFERPSDFSSASSDGEPFYVADAGNKDKKMGELPHTSTKISQDIRGLTREQHGVVSSATNGIGASANAGETLDKSSSGGADGNERADQNSKDE